VIITIAAGAAAGPGHGPAAAGRAGYRLRRDRAERGRRGADTRAVWGSAFGLLASHAATCPPTAPLRHSCPLPAVAGTLTRLWTGGSSAGSPALAPRGGMTVSSAACVGNDGHLVWTRQRAGDRPQLLLRGVAATADQGTSRRAGDAHLRGRSLLKRPLTRIMVGFPASKRGGPRARLSCIAQHLMLLWGPIPEALFVSAPRWR
jgi:hypothetical protein